MTGIGGIGAGGGRGGGIGGIGAGGGRGGGIGGIGGGIGSSGGGIGDGGSSGGGSDSGQVAASGRASEPPDWLIDLAKSAERMEVPELMRPPRAGGRHSAILVLFGAGSAGPDVLLVQRSQSLRRHAGQPAFPGGAVDADDDGPVAAALREAAEEARVDPAGVQVIAVLPDLYIMRSGFRVSPVLAWWRNPGPVAPGDPAEITAVARIPMTHLADPSSRLTIRYPSGGAGPAFRAGGMLVWGFTAFLLDRLVAMGGWELPWDSARVVDLPPEAGTSLVALDGHDQAS